MSVFLQPIYTQTVGSTAVNTITFNNIPQTFTDLFLKLSLRTDDAAVEAQFFMMLNGSSSNFTYTELYGTGSSTGTSRSVYSRIGSANGSQATSNSFSSHDVYISNYTGSNYKQIICDNVMENNATFSVVKLNSLLWSSTSSITSLSIEAFGSQKFTQYSTFSLYGVLRQGI